MEEKGGKDQIEVVDNFEYSDDYKKKVCLPYFKDLYRVCTQNLRKFRICLVEVTKGRKGLPK